MKKTNWKKGLKEFFRPSFGKILLYVLFLGLVIFLGIFFRGNMADVPKRTGIPLSFKIEGCTLFEETCFDEFNVLYLLLDIVFNIVGLYVISCLFIFTFKYIIRKWKKK